MALTLMEFVDIGEWTALGSTNPQDKVLYRKDGNMVTVVVNQINGLTQETDYTIGTLPEGYRPATTIFGSSYGYSTTANHYLAVRYTGEVIIHTSTGGTIIRGSIVFPVNA